jgi:hypothetical protein
MSINKFIKSECTQCGGHLEFPADAVGEVIDCPHCGQPTKLVATVLVAKLPRTRILSAGLMLMVLVLASGLAVFVFVRKPATAIRPVSSKLVTNQVATKSPRDEILTNEFSITAIKLEKTVGSSLMYVTGEVRNLSERQRFGVKLVLGLTDTNQVPVGEATDYHQVLEPRASWRFKALVLDSKTASAHFDSVGETP